MANPVTESAEIIAIWDLLFTPEAAALITLVGVIFAALISFTGILTNNFFENRRRKKQRQYELVRETYISAVDYLAFCYHQILKIGSGVDIVFGDENLLSTQNFYKLFLVASPSVIKNFTQIGSIFSSETALLSTTLMDFKKYEVEIESFQKMFDFYNSEVKKNLEKMERYNEEGKNNPKIFEHYKDQFAFAQEKKQEETEKEQKAQKDKYLLQMELIRKSIQSVIKISPLIYECIFSMRKDLERKLKDEEMKAIKQSFDLMLEDLEQNLEGFLSQVDKKVFNYINS